MKKYLVIFLLFVSLFFVSSKISLAEGTFQLTNLPPQLTALVGSDFSTRIDFIYSGQYPENLGVSVTGLNETSGVKLGKIVYGTNGVNNIWLTGEPTNSYIGDNQLTLILTDNNGALLTKTFNLKISNPTFTFTDNETLPNVVSNSAKFQSQKIKFTYNGNDNLSVCFHSPSENLQVEIVNANNGKCVQGVRDEVLLNMLAKKVGQYSITAYASYGKGLETRKNFTLNVTPVGGTTVSVPTNSNLPSLNVTTVQKNENKEIKVSMPKEKTNIVPATTATQKTKIEEPKPVEKAVFSSEQKQATTTIKTSTTTPQIITKEVKKENIFVRAWKQFFSWF